MGPIGDISTGWTGGVQKPAPRGRVLQKLKAPSGLHGEWSGDAASQRDDRRAARATTLHCAGTEESVPFRHAPRLTSPFVAQLLGQLLPNSEVPASQARMAYGISQD